jgi:hypothetical protein
MTYVLWGALLGMFVWCNIGPLGGLSTAAGIYLYASLVARLGWKTLLVGLSCTAASAALGTWAVLRLDGIGTVLAVVTAFAGSFVAVILGCSLEESRESRNKSGERDSST